MACVIAVRLHHSCESDAFQKYLQEQTLTMHMQCLVSTSLYRLYRIEGKVRASCTTGGVQPAASRGPIHGIY